LYVSLHSPLIDKLMVLADGDVDLLSEAIHACNRPREVGWWRKRTEWAADLGDVVRYIVRKSNKR